MLPRGSIIFVLLLVLLAACAGEAPVAPTRGEEAAPATAVRDGEPAASPTVSMAEPAATAEPRAAVQRLIYTRLNAPARRDELWSANLDGSDEQLLLQPSYPPGPADATRSIVALVAARDGSRVAYALDGMPGEIHLMRPDGSEDTVIAGGGTLSRGAFSPDGTRVAFLRMREDGSAPVPEGSIWSYDIARGEALQLTSWQYFYGEPFWLDNQTLAFSMATQRGTPPAGWMTFRVALEEGATPEQLTQGRLLEVAPQGGELLVAVDRPPAADPATSDGEATVALNLYDVERGEPSVLLGSAGPGLLAAWAPDSSAIALNVWLTMTESSLMLAGADGSATPLKNIPGMTMFTDLTWGAPGEQLVYAADSALWVIDAESRQEQQVVASAGRFVVVVTV